MHLLGCLGILIFGFLFMFIMLGIRVITEIVDSIIALFTGRKPQTVLARRADLAHNKTIPRVKRAATPHVKTNAAPAASFSEKTKANTWTLKRSETERLKDKKTMR